MPASDSKHLGLDYLQGRTQRCETPDCKNRAPSLEDTKCTACESAYSEKQLEGQLQAPSVEWYVRSGLYNGATGEHDILVFVCRTCHKRSPAEGLTKPIEACCTNTHACQAANDFWGEWSSPYLVLADHLAK